VKVTCAVVAVVLFAIRVMLFAERIAFAIIIAIRAIYPVFVTEVKIQIKKIVKIVIGLWDAIGIGLIVNAITSLNNSGFSDEKTVSLFAFGACAIALGKLLKE
jgi:hypothetical protein